MSDIRMADVSEWQSNVDAPAYLNAGHKCIIARAYSGYRADKTFPGRRDYLRKYAFTGIGYYCYLASDVDPKTQANGFINAVGQLKDNEWAILDVEEGSGSQTSRAQAWFDVVDKWAGFQSMLYASLYFFRDQLSGVGHWGSRPIWIAAYSSSEPSDHHDLWQFSDSYHFDGIGSCDGNLAHKTADDFIKQVRGGQAPTPSPTPEPITEEDMIAAVVKKNGALEVFVEKDDGRVYHTWQQAENGKWYSADGGKTIGWQAMGKPGG
jgi:GH25 family lysozyme M1 (1,4-beta-N-acetylmuramidase)